MATLTSDGLRSELERGLTLPASWYSDPAILALEHSRIFAHAWQYAGPAEQVARPGDFLAARVGDTPVVIARGRDGALRGFVNVCRHRGHQVVSGCGHRLTLQCPYHAWTYDLDGALLTAPRSEREPNFDRADWSLLPIAVDAWGPLIFACRDPDAAPLAETLGPLPEQMAARGLPLDGLTYRGRSREFLVEANWKLVVENFLECYHCPVAHQSFSRLIDVAPDAYKLTTTPFTSSQYGPVLEGRRDAPYVPEGPIRRAEFHFVWPNWTLNTFPGPAHVRVLVFQPVDENHTATFVDGFWAPDTSDETIDEMTSFGTVVGQEDVDLVQSVHRGLRSGRVEQGRLLLEAEHLLQHFQLLVHDAVVGADT